MLKLKLWIWHKQSLVEIKILWFLNLIQPKSLNAKVINYSDKTLKYSGNFSNSHQSGSTGNITLNPHEIFPFPSQNFPEISIYEKYYYCNLYIYTFILFLLQDKIRF